MKMNGFRIRNRLAIRLFHIFVDTLWSRFRIGPPDGGVFDGSDHRQRRTFHEIFDGDSAAQFSRSYVAGRGGELCLVGHSAQKTVRSTSSGRPAKIPKRQPVNGLLEPHSNGTKKAKHQLSPLRL